jgi:Ca-activated chloride channel family protein
MVRLFACVLLAVSVVSVQGAQQGQTGQGQEPSTFRSGSDLVRAYVTVTDKDGRLVSTLTQKDFELRDEGKPQPIAIFDNTPRAIRLIVMLDVSGSMEGNLPLLRAAAGQLLQRLRPEDGARVGTFGKDVTVSPSFTRDANELLASLPTTIDPEAPTPLWRAVDKAMEAFGTRDTEARDVVLVLSDGKDSGFTGFRDRFITQADVIDRARRQDVMVYSIGMRSRGARQVPGLGAAGLQAALLADQPDPGLARVAEESGGGYAEIRFGEDLGAAFARVADELHSQYLLGFDPPRRDGKVHKIQINVAQSGMKPRARKDYVAPKG